MVKIEYHPRKVLYFVNRHNARSSKWLTHILSPFLEFMNQNHSLRKLSRFWCCPHFLRTWSKKSCPEFQNGDKFFKEWFWYQEIKCNKGGESQRIINDQDFTGILPKWLSHQGSILAKEQLHHLYIFWAMPILIFSSVQIIMRHPILPFDDMY